MRIDEKNKKEVRRILSEFKKQSNNESLNELENIENLNLPKCKCCGEHIYYDHSIIRLKKDMTLDFFQGLYTTSKVIGNNKYNLKVCQKCFNNEFPETLEKSSSKYFNTLGKYTKFAFEPSDDDYELGMSDKGVTLNILQKRYGKEEGKKRFEDYKKKQAYSNSFEYKQKKYGWTKEQYNEFNKSRAITLENLQKKYGKKEGKKRFEDYREKQAYIGCKLEYFIEKYGEQAGYDYYQEIGRKKAKGTLNNGYSHYSKNSQSYFNKIKNYLFDIGHNFNMYYATNNGEIFIQDDNNTYFYDCYIKELNLVIEYNGDYWHANPKKYKSTDIIRDKEVSDIWKYDKYKESLVKENHYNIEIVWESEEIEPEILLKKYIEIYENKKDR